MGSRTPNSGPRTNRSKAGDEIVESVSRGLVGAIPEVAVGVEGRSDPGMTESREGRAVGHFTRPCCIQVGRQIEENHSLTGDSRSRDRLERTEKRRSRRSHRSKTSETAQVKGSSGRILRVRAKRAMVPTLTQLQFHHGPGFGDHGTRVAELSAGVARFLGLKSHEAERLGFAALVHDLGKIDIEPSVLEKLTPLTDNETWAVHQHPQIGHHRIVELVHPAVSEAVLCHHECWDGSGYPGGLRGNEVPLLARIIFVADAYDVMTVGRSYRPPMTISRAGEELTRGAGRQFDPTVVDAFASLDRRLLSPVTPPGKPLRDPPRSFEAFET